MNPQPQPRNPRIPPGPATLGQQRLLDLYDAELPNDLYIEVDPEAILTMLEAEIDERYVPPKRTA